MMTEISHVNYGYFQKSNSIIYIHIICFNFTICYYSFCLCSLAAGVVAEEVRAIFHLYCSAFCGQQKD